MDSTQARFGRFLVTIGVLTEKQNHEILQACTHGAASDYYKTAVRLGYLKAGTIDAYFSQFTDTFNSDEERWTT